MFLTVILMSHITFYYKSKLVVTGWHEVCAYFYTNYKLIVSELFQYFVHWTI